VRFPTKIKKVFNKNNNIKAHVVRKSSRIRVYNAMALPVLPYGRGIWTLRKKRITAIGINRDEIFQTNSWVHNVCATKEMNKFWKS
jgi:hypothetical protein